MNPQPKQKIYRNKKYLKWIDDGYCEVCERPNPTHHHIRKQKWGSGTGIKPHDYVCVRRCHACHDPKYDDLFGCELEIRDNLVAYFQEIYSIDELINMLMQELDRRV